MDINNELQQINTFVKGMNTDVSDALIDSSQYRYAENVRLTTNKDENTGELRLIEGTSAYSNLSEYGDIIAMTSIRNLLVVITQKQNGTNYILVRDGESPAEQTSWEPVFQSSVTERPFSKHLSLVTRWENSNDIKLYIADDEHGLSYINIANPDDIVLGFDNIKSDVNVSLYQITAELSASAGTIPPVKVQYAYRLYKEGGASTGLSPLSNIIVLYDGDKGYDNITEYTGKAVDVTIQKSSESEKFDYMQIYRLSFRQVGQQPEVNLIYDSGFTFVNNKFTYTDNGYNIQSNSFEEFLSMFYYNIKPTVIESKGDYLFAANIKYEQDDVDERLKDYNFRLYSSGDYDEVTPSIELDYNKQFMSDSIAVYNEDYWKYDDPIVPGHTIYGGIGTFMEWEYNIKHIYCTKDNHKYKDYDPNTGALSNRIYDQCNSLRQGEVYRYGAIFYDDKGKKSSVKWLCDIMAPMLYGQDGFSTIVYDNTTIFKIPIIGIDFRINSLPDGFSAVEIVRCDRTVRDKITYTQGIAGFPYHISTKERVEDSWEEKPVLCAPYLLSSNKFLFDPKGAHDDNIRSKAVSDNKRLAIACPEYTYQSDDVQNLFSGKKLVVRKARTLYKYSTTHPSCEISNEEAALSATMRGGTPGSDEFAKAYAYENEINNNRTQLHILSDNSNYWNVVEQDGLYIWKYDWIAGFNTVYYYPQINPQSKLYRTSGVEYHVPNVSLTNIQYYVDSSNTDSTVKNVQDISFTAINPNDSSFPKYNTFLDNKTPNYKNSSVNIGGLQYINWSVPLIYNIQSDYVEGTFTQVYEGDNYYIPLCMNIITVKDCFPILNPAGSTGKYILINLGEESFDFSNTNNRIETFEVNLRNESATPYGGVATINSSSYISYGFYKKGTGTLSVFDGDCYPGVFEFNAQHSWFSPEIITKGGSYFNGIRQATVCYAPIESDIDLSATYGDLYSRLQGNKTFYFQDIEASFDGFTQAREAYLYNTAYSDSPDDIQYSSITYTSISDNEYDCRVYHSNVKTNGELIDNWLNFSPLNYIDVDSRFGQITNMRLFKDKLLFWQEHATGILSVNERTVLNDLENNDIVVGTGGTLQRYDYISTVYGMKPYQYEAEVQSNTVQYWWDGYNKEILAYGGGMELVQLTKLKGVTNYINEREESEHPMLSYDTKYDELLCQVVNDGQIDETLVYNEQVQAFSSIYTFQPWYRATVSNNLYLVDTDTSCIYIHNTYDNEYYSLLFNNPTFPKIKIVINKNNIYTKTFDNLTFGGRMYKGSFIPKFENVKMERVDGYYIMDKDHMNSPMHHLKFTFETPLKQKSSVRGDNATSVDEYDFRLAVPRNGQEAIEQIKDDEEIHNTIPQFDNKVDYGNRMRGKTMQCEIASDYNSTDFSLQYITTKFRMSWS